ncbi:MAG: GAF domain-containing sensor histidine kinase [Oscillatoriales cyanobacterium SM2_2_1]|nr:GAF domain-containing sensor histidine kinase [Oscillatoriales cyanobacterium SM2_2_1]
MPAAPTPKNEAQRQQALERYDILDTSFEEIYTEIVELAAEVCQTPMALISLIDRDRQWFKAAFGLDSRETPREYAFCAHAILHPDHTLIVPDAALDHHFADNPLVLGAPHIRFYAGVPLITTDGYALGTLCTLDTVPRTLSPTQERSLRTLARQVMNQLELRLTVRYLREANSTKEKFFSIISHDLRTPFNGILGLSEILKNSAHECSPEEIQELSTDIYTSADTAYHLLENLLQWAKLETQGISFHPTELLLTTVVERAVKLLTGVAQQKNIRLQVLTLPAQTMIADANMVQSILQNLIANSIKFTASGGVVTLTVWEESGSIQFQIRDTGIGISPERLATLFQIEHSKSTLGTDGEKGTGLGLLLCQQFAQQHGGCIRVTSELGKGTEFTVILPRFPPEPDNGSAPD